MACCKQISKRTRRADSRGFTLAELLIAMMAGLLIAIAAFSFSKQATRAFAQEARIASAQMSVLAGFQKLQADVSRAAYMASPNFARDAGLSRICGYNEAPDTYWPSFLVGTKLTGLSVTVEGSKTAPQVTKVPDATGSYPDSVRIVGNLSTAEAFTVLAIMKGVGNGHDIYIHTNDGPATRAGFLGATGGQFTEVFLVGRLIRVMDKQNHQHYGIVSAATWNGGQAYISTRLPLALKGEGANPLCAIDGIGTDTQVNVVNIVDYGITNLSTINNTVYNNTIYSAGATVTGDDARTELVRREWLIGDAVPDKFYEDPTSLVVAEYAFDLRFALWTSDRNSGCTAATGGVGLLRCDYSSAKITTLMTVAAVYNPGDPPTGPESVRAVQVRLAARSREVDRAVDLTTTSPPLTGGAVYRHKVGTSGYARARSLVADVTLLNQRGDAW